MRLLLRNNNSVNWKKVFIAITLQKEYQRENCTIS